VVSKQNVDGGLHTRPGKLSAVFSKLINPKSAVFPGVNTTGSMHLGKFGLVQPLSGKLLFAVFWHGGVVVAGLHAAPTPLFARFPATCPLSPVLPPVHLGRPAVAQPRSGALLLAVFWHGVAGVGTNVQPPQVSGH